jgi:hypothetical protein
MLLILSSMIQIINIKLYLIISNLSITIKNRIISEKIEKHVFYFNSKFFVCLP